jgi:hypothetical protein
VPVIVGAVVRVYTEASFLVYKVDTHQIAEVTGRKVKILCSLKTDAVYSQMIAIGNRTIGLSQNSIDSFDIISGDNASTFSVAPTEKWILSVEPSYGIVAVGTKSYTISKAGIGPYITLYGRKEYVVDELRKVKEKAGTVAAPLLLMSNRSTYLAAVLSADDIAKEIQNQPLPGSIQDCVRPMVMTLHDLLLHKPA